MQDARKKEDVMHNNSMKRMIFLTSLMFSLLVGCGIVATPIPSSETRTIASTSILTNTPISLPSLTPTVTPNSGIKLQCIEINDHEVQLQDAATGGTILMGAYPDNPFLLDLKTGIRYKLPFTRKEFEQGNGMSLSPDRRSLAYVEMLKDQAGEPAKEMLRVVDARGNILAQTTFNRTDLYLERWLNNQSLQFNLNRWQGDGSVMVFNLFTGEQRTISDELPQLNRNDLPGVTWRVEYSSNLEWVVYQAMKTEQDGVGPIVWDVINKKILWQSPFSGFEYEQPVWSPAGDEVAISVSDRLYIISRSAQARLIFDDSQSRFLDHLAWSPDGRYIAFRSFPKSSPKGSVMVYDLQTKQVVDYCIISDNIDDTPVWSPDSHQLIVAVRKEVDGSLVDLLILVDIEKNTAYQIPITMGLSPWMKSLP